MPDTLEAWPTFSPCQILALEFKKSCTTYSMAILCCVCQILKKLSQIFKRVWMLLQPTSQLCFSKYNLWCGLFLISSEQLVPELMICN